jgi:hypothetical protein
MVKYAKQMCVRPSEATNANLILPENIVQDVNKIMDQIKIDMSKQLSAECERRAGIWVDLPWQDDEQDGFHDITGDILNATFYTNTAANTKWGYCKTPPTEETHTITYTITYKTGGCSSCTFDGQMEQTLCTYGKPCKLRKNSFKAFNRDAYGIETHTFKNWEYGNDTYEDEATVIDLTNVDGATIELKATWTKK